MKRRHIFLLPVVSLLAALSIWAAFDLFGQRAHSLRDFSPSEVARLDTAMWRSYYARERVPLFFQLARLMRQEYHLSRCRSFWVAYQAARAAFAFREGHNRNDYERALPYLNRFYGAISAASDEPFDADRAAQFELAWWIVHRERDLHSPEVLPRLLAETEAVVYHMGYEALLEHGKLRAEAMRLRDSRAMAGRLTDEDWLRIESLLDKSWHSLWQAVNEHSKPSQ